MTGPVSDRDVAAGLAARGLTVADAAAARLAAFLNLLEQWNRVHNLTGIRDRTELIERHLAESLALEPYLRGPRIADIGTGAGLPGLPLAIVLPAMQFTLIESRRKRVNFLRHVVLTLALDNVTVARGRAEELSLVPFSTVLARAVAPPAELLDVARPLIAPGGRLVLLTGASRGREIVELARDFAAVPAEAPGLASAIVVLERAPSESEGTNR
jgi:16S rRNA (guanine527-N7)-methyltransferase